MKARRVIGLSDQLQRLALAGHHDARRNPIAPQQPVIDLAPLDAVSALAFQLADPSADLLEPLRERPRVGPPKPQFEREERYAPDARGQQASAVPVALHLPAQIVGP